MTHAESSALARQHRAEYQAGATIKQLAAMHGLSFIGMYSRLRRAGTMMRPTGAVAGARYSDIPWRVAMRERDERIIAAVRQTGNQTAVARAFGISHQRVHQIVHKAKP